VNWDQINRQNRMRAHGIEPASGPLSKDALRRQADALLAASKIPVQKLAPSARSTASADAPQISRASGGAPQIAVPLDERRLRSIIRKHKETAQSRRAGFDTAVPPGLVVYADGCCHPNPGVGGWGFVVYRDGVEIHSEHGGDLIATNQTMELTAAIMALRWIDTRSAGASVATPLSVRLFSDSMYVVNGCNDWRHGWKAKGWKRGGPNAKPENAAIANLALWQELDGILTDLLIQLEWVKGHAGIVGNERADELSEIGRESAIEAARPRDLLADQFQRYAVIEGGAA